MKAWQIVLCLCLVLAGAFLYFRPRPMAERLSQARSLTLFDNPGRPALPAPREPGSQSVLDNPKVRERLDRFPRLKARLEARGARRAPPAKAVRWRQGKLDLVWDPEVYALDEAAWTGGGTVVDKRGGMVFLKSEGAIPTGALGAVYDAKRGQYSAVTGNLILRTRGEGSAEALAKDYSLSVAHQVGHLNYAVLQTAAGSVDELVALMNRVARDERVARAELEIVGTRPVPQ